jgi:hypothetical protein
MVMNDSKIYRISRSKPVQSFYGPWFQACAKLMQTLLSSNRINGTSTAPQSADS